MAGYDNSKAKSGQSYSLTAQVVFATVVMIGLVAGMGGWAATTTLSGAVIAPGTFVVERNVKKIQHNYGGIVSKINVRNGDRVEAGDVLLQLDATQIGAELEIVKSQLLELRARSARLVAERDGLDTIPFSDELLAAGDAAKSAIEGETRLFHENQRARDNQKEQLRLRVTQLNEEITGLTAQRDAKGAERELIKRELDQIRELHDKKLTAVSRVYAMEREERRLGGEYGGLVAQIARANGQINEINVEIIGVDENTRATAQRELRSIDARLAELQERAIAAQDKFQRVDIRAPQTGIVHELSAHTIGGVISAAEQIMLIVPEEDNLTIQAKIAPSDVDQVAAGRPARLRLSAFNQQNTPEITGYVTRVSADVTIDPKSGQSYYMASIDMDEKDLRHSGELKLLPGMPVEVFIATGERTAISYLAKPFTDQINRAFRE
ncbi:MAG: HlyD family type I secretion periplasmic adaptor subunit [Hyphomicrobium sp.]|nr:HlyD family type I secretion periplasmic adaptor subunit [Hyphomicrobium sp.]